MKNNFKLKQKLLPLMAIVILTLPVATSAQSLWDVFTSNYWYSIVLDDSEPPNDDKKPKSPNPQPAPPQPIPNLPPGEYCQNEYGELVPCTVNK